MTYVRYSTGFKGGGFSPRPADALQTAPFKPEYLKTAELGGKTEFLNHRVRFNTDFFYSKYLDQQTFAQQLDSAGANWFREVNAGTARIWGLEGELQAEPVDRAAHRWSASATSITGCETTAAITLLFTGDDCGGETCYSPRTPKFTGALGVQYTHAVRRRPPHAAPRHDLPVEDLLRGQQRLFGPDSPVGCGQTDNQGGYAVLNGRLAWETANKKWKVALWGRNLRTRNTSTVS